METLDLKTLDIGNVHATYKDSYVRKSVDTKNWKKMAYIAFMKKKQL